MDNERCAGADCPAVPAPSPFQFRQTRSRALPMPTARCHFCPFRTPTQARSCQSILEATVRRFAKARARSDARFRGRARKEAGGGGARKSFMAANHSLARTFRIICAGNHFPMQNWLKIASRTASSSPPPKSSSMAWCASSRSTANISGVAPASIAASARAIAFDARRNCSR